MIVWMMGVIVILSSVLVAAAIATAMRMLHHDCQSGTRHVNERYGEYQKTLENAAHVVGIHEAPVTRSISKAGRAKLVAAVIASRRICNA